jgi:hypothetical protein
MTLNEILFIVAVSQHQRWRDGKINLKGLINFFYRDSVDYCLEAWISWKLKNK